MPHMALIPVQNLQHNVLAPHTRDPQISLRALTEQYFRTQVSGVGWDRRRLRSRLFPKLQRQALWAR